MNLPMQSKPVERTLGTQPFADRGNSASGAPNGVGPSGQGMQPSFDWGGLLGTVAQTALPAILGAI
jgi:hypothetical protein